MSGFIKKEEKKKPKNDPKGQRKPQNTRPPANPAIENKIEDKVSNKPATEEPGPEFYKNLKRETDEIIKMSEESNAKYSKKVIKSNWEKYEAPIDSYEEREEVENMGADFEQLMNAPLSSGGHFQFKHEKSWDTVNKSTLYDKYFDINMSDLAICLSSLPFNERNDLDLKLFTNSEILSMAHRSQKFKHCCQKSDEISAVNNIENELLKKLHVTNISGNISKEDITNAEESHTEHNEVFKTTVTDNLNISEVNTKFADLSLTKRREKINSIDGCGDEGSEKEEDLEEWLDDFLSSN